LVAVFFITYCFKSKDQIVYIARLKGGEQMKLINQASKLVLIGFLIFQLTACSGTRAAGNETWTLIKIVSQGDHIDTFTDTVIVKNCGIVQPKTISCSSGTTKDLSVSIGGGTEFGEGAKFSIDGSVSTSLGIGRESGESVELEIPPEGSVYVFTVNKEYRVTAGELIAQSSNGEQQTTSYNFNASCSIQVANKRQESCSNGDQSSETINLPGEVWKTDIQEAHIYQHHPISEIDFTNFSFEADVIINSSTSEYHGLLFRHVITANDNDFYSFRITPDGYFAFDLWQDSPDSSFTTILGPSRSNAINTGAGQINHLKVVAYDGTFELFINNQKVGTITDSTFTNGKVGFISCTCDGSSNASATYLNAVISQNP
jgi:hypothetical protein